MEEVEGATAGDATAPDGVPTGGVATVLTRRRQI